MQYWLLKSEPNVWSIDQQEKVGDKGTPWDGVRNYQAAKNLKTMKKGDKCFFYHSNIGKEIVGIVEVIKEYYLDKSEPTQRDNENQESFNERFLKWQDRRNMAEGKAEIIISKQRHGPTGTVKVEFEGIYTTFKDLTKN